jgi:hypothetical protein
LNVRVICSPSLATQPYWFVQYATKVFGGEQCREVVAAVNYRRAIAHGALIENHFRMMAATDGVAPLGRDFFLGLTLFGGVRIVRIDYPALVVIVRRFPVNAGLAVVHCFILYL